MISAGSNDSLYPGGALVDQLSAARAIRFRLACNLVLSHSLAYFLYLSHRSIIARYTRLYRDFFFAFIAKYNYRLGLKSVSVEYCRLSTWYSKTRYRGTAGLHANIFLGSLIID